MRRHIIHAIESLGVGGAQAILFELYLAIDRHFPGYKQTVLLLNPKKVHKEYVASYGVPYEAMSNRAAFEQRVKTAKKPKVLLFHKLMGSSPETLRPLFRALPVVVVNHSYSPSPRNNRIRYCNGVVSVSQSMRNLLVKKFKISGHHRVIRNGVNHIRYDPIGAVPRDCDGLLTGRVNAMNRIKHPEDWVDWCAQLELPVPMTHEYIGDGAGRKRSRKRYKDLDKKRNTVRLLGSINDFEQKIARVKSWDLFLYEICSPEGISVSVLESLASGVPVICSKHASNTEIISEGENGFVFDNREHAREILTRLAIDPKRLSELRDTTRKHFAKHLDASRMAEEYIDFMEDIAKEKPTRQKEAQTRKTPEGPSKPKQQTNQRRKRLRPGAAARGGKRRKRFQPGKR